MRPNTKIFLTIFPIFILFFNLFSVHVTPNFGKTHFIVGVNSSEVSQQKRIFRLKNRLEIPSNAQHITQVFFAPDDDTRSILLDLIACEKSSILVAAYLLTDSEIAKALILAKKRGVIVQFVTDKFCCNGKFGKAKLLHQSGIDVLVYHGQQEAGSYMSDIMHNKFILFKNNLLGRSLVWTGSFNFTNSARLRNQENILLLDNMDIIKKYVQQFNLLKTRCVRYDASKFAGVERKKIYKKNKSRRRSLRKTKEAIA